MPALPKHPISVIDVAGRARYACPSRAPDVCVDAAGSARYACPSRAPDVTVLDVTGRARYACLSRTRHDFTRSTNKAEIGKIEIKYTVTKES